MDLLSVLFPKEKRFYKMIEEQAVLVGAAVEHFNTLIGKYHTLTPKKRKQLVRLICTLEQKDDVLYTKIIRELKSTFITPMDREDIQQIVGTFDSLIDLLELLTLKISAFNMTRMSPYFKKQADLLSQAYTLINKCIFSIKDEKQVEKHCIKMRVLEQEADSVYISGLQDMFSDSMKPIDIIKLQDLYTSMEKIIDQLNDAALIIENLAVKYS